MNLSSIFRLEVIKVSVGYLMLYITLNVYNVHLYINKIYVYCKPVIG